MIKRLSQKNTEIFLIFGMLLFLLPITSWAGENIAALQAKEEAGDTTSRSLLGWIYANGWGVPKDYGKAAHWDRLAAHQGLASAQYNLGVIYANGPPSLRT